MSKTIVVTRAKGDEVEITEGLQEMGHHVIHEPLTEIFLDHTLRGEMQRLMGEDPDAIIVTSKHALQALSLLTEIRDSFILCVGEATADMAYSQGFTRVEVTGQTVEELIDYIRNAYDETAHFLYISGTHIKSDLPSILENFGMECIRIVAYEAIATQAMSDTLLEQLKRGQVDAITFFSPRNAEIFCKLLKDEEAVECSLLLDAFCFSEEVASKTRVLAWQKIHVCSEPTLASMLAKIDTAYSKDRNAL
jgi:uroporphyrinogen-III synthase